MHKNHGWPDNLDISLISTDPRNCYKCGYEAEDLYDFHAHTWGEHDDDASNYGVEESIESQNMSKQEIQKNDCPVRCNFCDEKFKTRRCVMVHKKVVQTEKVAVCWNL